MSQRILPPEHVAYMQIKAVGAIKSHSIVYPTGEITDDGIPEATSVFNVEKSTCVVGVSDSFIADGARGTVIVAGIATLYGEIFKPNPSASTSLKFGRIIFAADVDSRAKEHGGLLPVGTLLATDVPGMVDDRSGTYTHGGKVFLCPWMSAFTAPRKHLDPDPVSTSDSKVSDDRDTTKWETYYDEDGTPRQKRHRTEVWEETRDMPPPDEAGHVDLRRMMGDGAIEAMISTLHGASAESEELDEERKKSMETFLCKVATKGIDAAKNDAEAMRTCFIQ